MAKNNLPTKVQPSSTAMALPAHLKDKEIKGLETVVKMVRPPYCKILQKATSDELLDAYGKGTALRMPDRGVLAEKGNSLVVTPVFMFTEYKTWTPYELKGQIPAVIGRSLDPRGAIALRALDPDRRIEEIEWGEKRLRVKVKHVEHLVFLMVLHDHPLTDDGLIAFSFSRGEHKTGVSLCNLVKQRKASIWAGRYVLTPSVEVRKNTAGEWHGFDVDNNVDAPWNDAEQCIAFEALNKELTEAHGKGLVEIADDDDNEAANRSEL